MRPACPKCGRGRTHRSRTRSPWERLLKAMGIRAFRCPDCNHRFLCFFPSWLYGR